MGIMKKGSKPEFKQYKNSTYYRKKITLIETTGEISIQVSANLQKDVRFSLRSIHICTSAILNVG